MQNLVLLYQPSPPILITATKAGHLDIAFSSTSKINIKSGDIMTSTNCDRRFVQIERCGDFVIGMMEGGKVDIYTVSINETPEEGEKDPKTNEKTHSRDTTHINKLALKKVGNFQSASACFTFSSAKSLLLFGDLTILSLTTFQSHRIMNQLFTSVALNPLHSHILLAADSSRVAIIDLKAKREIYTSNISCKTVMWHPTDPLKVIIISNGIKNLCLSTGAVTDVCEGTSIKYSHGLNVIRNKGLIVDDGWKKVKSHDDVDFDILNGMIAADDEVKSIERFMAINGARRFIFITDKSIIHKKIYNYSNELEVKESSELSVDEKILELIPEKTKLKDYLETLVDIPKNVTIPTETLHSILSRTDFILDNLSSYEYIILATYLNKPELLAEHGDISYWPLLLLTSSPKLIERLEGNEKLSAIAIWELNKYFESKMKNLKRPENVEEWLFIIEKIGLVADLVKKCDGNVDGEEYIEYKKYKNIKDIEISHKDDPTKMVQSLKINNSISPQGLKSNNLLQRGQESSIPPVNNERFSGVMNVNKANSGLQSSLMKTPNSFNPSFNSSVNVSNSRPNILSNIPNIIPNPNNNANGTHSNIPRGIQSNIPKIPITPNNMPNVAVRPNQMGFSKPTTPNIQSPKINNDLSSTMGLNTTTKNHIIPNIAAGTPLNSYSPQPINTPQMMANNKPNLLPRGLNSLPTKQLIPGINNKGNIIQPGAINSPQLSNTKPSNDILLSAPLTASRSNLIPHPQRINNLIKPESPKLVQTPQPVSNKPQVDHEQLSTMVTNKLTHLIELARKKGGILIQSRVTACIRDVQPIFSLQDISALNIFYRVLTDDNDDNEYSNVDPKIVNGILGLRAVCNE